MLAILDELDKEDLGVEQLFQGELRSTLTCACGSTSTKVDAFWTLAVSVDDGRDLEDLCLLHLKCI